jgi:hypothetical protein
VIVVVFTGYGGIEEIRCYTLCIMRLHYNASYCVMDYSIKDMAFHNQNLPFHDL